MKCFKCKTEMIRILKKDYCPHCVGVNFKLYKHAKLTKDYTKSIRAVLWGTATALTLVVFFTSIKPLILPTDTDVSRFIFLSFGLISLGTAGFVISFFDQERYVFDSFLVALVLAVSDAVFGILSFSEEPMLLSFFSNVIVFFLTILLGSFWLFFIDRRDD